MNIFDPPVRQARSDTGTGWLKPRVFWRIAEKVR
jgi:hypothetical protein